jgi:hypothetical protein
MPAEERRFHCRLCRRGFRSHTSLKSHMNEHATPRRCRLCSKQLRDNEYHRC